MGARQDKGDRRSWKNILINKRYQLRFTLFMVGLSTVLMLSLGYWVLREAKKATTVGINEVQGRNCQELATIPAGADRKADPAAMPPAPSDSPEQAGPEIDTEADNEAGPEADTEADTEADNEADTEAGSAGDSGASTAAGAAEPAGEQGEERERPKIDVQIGTMEIEPPAAAPPEPAAVVNEAVLAECRKEQTAKIAKLSAGYQRIKLVLLAFGVLMVFGLTLYGIKTTHKVAGPLYKVTLYFDKLRMGKYDKVYNLRKGDQLVEFYEYFKAAHLGLENMQKKDVEVLRGLIDAAEKAQLGDRSPEIAALLDEMRETLKRKEKSLE